MTSDDCKAPSRYCQSKVVIKLHVFGRAGEASGFPGRPGVQGAEPLAASLKQTLTKQSVFLCHNRSSDTVEV